MLQKAAAQNDGKLFVTIPVKAGKCISPPPPPIFQALTSVETFVRGFIPAVGDTCQLMRAFQGLS